MNEQTKAHELSRRERDRALQALAKAKAIEARRAAQGRLDSLTIGKTTHIGTPECLERVARRYGEEVLERRRREELRTREAARKPLKARTTEEVIADCKALYDYCIKNHCSMYKGYQDLCIAVSFSSVRMAMKKYNFVINTPGGR